MTLQPFVGPWPLLQFRNHFYTDGSTLWTSDQTISRPLPRHRATQTQNKPHTDICALSGIRTHDPIVRASEDSSCTRPRGRCDGRRFDYSRNIPGNSNFILISNEQLLYGVCTCGIGLMWNVSYRMVWIKNPVRKMQLRRGILSRPSEALRNIVCSPIQYGGVNSNQNKWRDDSI
jgi:hypothetical protein